MALFNKSKSEKVDVVGQQVEEFTDFGGISTKSLKFGVWLTSNRQHFLLTAIWTLIILAAIFWSYTVYFVANYLLVDLKQEETYLMDVTTGQSGVTVPKAENYQLKVSWLYQKTIPTATGRYDLVGSITNDNEDVYGVFDYYFRVDGKETTRYSGVIYPKEKKYLVHLSEAADTSPADVKLVVEGLYLNQFNKHDMPDWLEFKSTHYDFLVKDKIFSPAASSGLSENLLLNRLSFNITNRSAYSYRQAEFLIILYSGSNIVGVDRHIIPEFRSGQKYQVQKTLVGALNGVTSFEVLPNINILDESVYLKNN